MALALILLAVLTPAQSRPPPTSAELQQLDALSTEQRAEVIDALGEDKDRAVKQPPLREPVLVSPRSRSPEQGNVDRSRLSRDKPGFGRDRGKKKSREKDRRKSKQRDRLQAEDREDREDSEFLYSDESYEQDLPLQPFGYDLFDGVPTTFAPATDIPISADYVIGPGDTVLIQLFGKEHHEYALVVTREGNLQLPRIGPVNVAGLEFDEMKNVLTEVISNQMIGEKVIVTMGDLRSIRVFILGDANQPGSYTVSALSTMTNALFVSGGVKPIGSLRNVQLKRRGVVVARLDLYDLLVRGDTSGDARLQPGDVIFIPPVGRTVGVAGDVRRPAIYELRNERTVDQVLALAGGMLPTAYPEASQIERINKRGERTLVDIDLGRKGAGKAAVQSGDELHIYSILEKMEDIVLVSGHVQRPGAYQWREGMRVTDLISSIRNDLLPRPDLNYALVKRETRKGGGLEMFSIRLGEALDNPASRDNAVLQARDELIVFGFSGERDEVIDPLIDELVELASFENPARVVRVGGLVRHSGDFPLEHYMKVSDLIRAGGGLSEAAYALGAELTRYEIVDGRNREVGHVNVDLAAILKGERQADFALHSHDYLHIKRLPAWAESSTVELKGEVRFPGIYPISRGEQLSNVIQRAGGLSDMAFPQGAVFLRVELKERERLRLDELSRRLESDLASLSIELSHEDKASSESLLLGQQLADQLRNVEPTGRLVISLPKLLSTTSGGRRSEYDITMMDGDQLYIPQLTQEVTVTGEVFYPTSHFYEEGIDREKYVKLSGGTTRKADRKHIYVVRADGSVNSVSTDFNYSDDDGTPWFEDVDEDAIRPGDTIVVPLDVDRMKPLTFWTGVSKIVFQLAFAAASAKAVGVF